METIIMDHDFLKIFKDKNVLLTGDTGFKGSWLAIWLNQLGAKVIGISLPPRTNRDNYNVCKVNEKINHIDGDIRDYKFLQKIFQKYKPEIIFHLAAQTLVLDSYENPHYTFHTNVMGTLNILELSRVSKFVKSVVNVTSDKCYENKESFYGYRENDSLKGKDPYSASKSASEIITYSYLKSFFEKEPKKGLASVRAGNVIGGGDWAENRIIPDCIRALENEEPIYMRNPNSIRPWQYVLEPLYGYLKIAACLFMEKKEIEGSWNFGPLHSNMVSVQNLVEEVIKLWGKGTYTIEENKQKLETNLLYLDISKAITKLNFYPVYNLKDTIKNTLEEYKIDVNTPNQSYEIRLDHIKKYLDKRSKFMRTEDAQLQNM